MPVACRLLAAPARCLSGMPWQTRAAHHYCCWPRCAPWCRQHRCLGQSRPVRWHASTLCSCQRPLSHRLVWSWPLVAWLSRRALCRRAAPSAPIRPSLASELGQRRQGALRQAARWRENQAAPRELRGRQAAAVQCGPAGSGASTASIRGRPPVRPRQSLGPTCDRTRRCMRSDPALCSTSPSHRLCRVLALSPCRAPCPALACPCPGAPHARPSCDHPQTARPTRHATRTSSRCGPG